jgi:hypothetical protein
MQKGESRVIVFHIATKAKIFVFRTAHLPVWHPSASVQWKLGMRESTSTASLLRVYWRHASVTTGTAGCVWLSAYETTKKIKGLGCM